MTVWIIIALLAGALFLVWSHRRNRQLGGLPAGDLIAADNEEQECPVIISHRYGLKGKPDALIRTRRGEMVPIERKRTRAPRTPYDGDLIQAIAYCLLIEDKYDQSPPYVRIQYADRWFDEPYTPERKRWALQISQRLREARRAGAVNRSHRVAAKCRFCSQRHNCDQALLISTPECSAVILTTA